MLLERASHLVFNCACVCSVTAKFLCEVLMVNGCVPVQTTHNVFFSNVWQNTPRIFAVLTIT